MRRILRPAALVAVLSLLAAGCGGGDDDKDETTTAAAPAASAGGEAGGGSTSAAAPSDAKSVLAGATVNATGPVHTTFTLKAAFEGQPTDPMLQAFLGTPLEVRLDGTADGSTRQSDVDVQLKAGAFNINAKVLSDGTTTWLGLSDAYYVLPTDTSGESPAPVDPAALTNALGDPSELVKDAELVGAEEIEGIATQHVRGTIDVARLGAGLSKAAEAAGGIGSALSGTPGETADPADTAALQKAVRSATIDAWVADDTRNLVRVLIELDIEVPEDQREAASGISGARVQLEGTTLPTDPLQVEAPADVRPAEELQTALLGILAGGLGASGSGGGLGDALGG